MSFLNITKRKKLLFLSMLYLCLLAKVVSLTYGLRYSRSEKPK